MATLAPERTVDEVVAGWRRGRHEDGPENPAGPVYAGGGYVEHEITMTGSGPGTCSEMSMSYDPVTGETYYCC